MNETAVFLNGEFVTADEARLPIMDRGLLFGDSVYELIPVYAGSLFRAEEHLQRLDRSLDAIRLKNPLSQSEWLDKLHRLAGCHPDQDQHLYIQVTRGTQARRQHAIPRETVANYFAFSQPVTPAESNEPAGIPVITTKDIRWERCDIKTNDLLANVLAFQEAQDQGAEEAIFIHHNLAIEGTASNLFMVMNKIIITPPKSHRLLPGVTRDLIIELARRHDLPCREADISKDELLHADEVWLTSSTREILPVIQIDQQVIGDGSPGPLWQQMNQYLLGYRSALRQQGAESR